MYESRINIQFNSIQYQPIVCNHKKISSVVENHSEREDMTTFISDYTKKDLHYSAKCYTFLI